MAGQLAMLASHVKVLPHDCPSMKLVAPKIHSVGMHRHCKRTGVSRHRLPADTIQACN
ncbi:hypothetical protein BS17DRAFT_785827 [Gyrodon lividus]|nr:hypothetical protein BS17DRAFT_785827 [Gyrodon lividus]